MSTASPLSMLEARVLMGWRAPRLCIAVQQGHHAVGVLADACDAPPEADAPARARQGRRIQHHLEQPALRHVRDALGAALRNTRLVLALQRAHVLAWPAA